MFASEAFWDLYVGQSDNRQQGEVVAVLKWRGYEKEPEGPAATACSHLQGREVTCLCSLPDEAQNQGLKECNGGSRSSKLLEMCLEQQEDLLSGGNNEILIF